MLSKNEEQQLKDFAQGLYKELLEETKDGASQNYLDLVNNTWLTGTEKLSVLNH